MPDPTFDDPFAKLFGKLPDPRAREIGTPTDDSAAADGSKNMPRADPEASPKSPTSPTAASAPPSRRAAREAAGRGASSPATTETPGHAVAPPTPVDIDDVDDDSASAGDRPVPASRLGEVIGAPTAANGRAVYARSETTPTIDVAPQSTADAASVDAAPREAVRTRTPGLEDLFTGATTTDDLGAPPPPVDKRRRRIGGWIALGVVLLVLGGIAGGAWYVWSTYETQIREVMGWQEPKDFEEGMANGEAMLTIVSGDTGQSISPKLFEAGVTKTPGAFYDYLVETSQNPPFVPGAFQLQQQMTSAAALDAILDPANKLENTALLREGLTVEQSVPILAEALGVPVEDVQAAVDSPAAYGVDAPSLEGWLFPATYTFDPGTTATDAVQRLVDQSVAALDAAAVPVEDRQRILTVASIIQREARYDDDMQKVSTVIENRLDPGNPETNGYLQMDSTAQYGYGELHEGSASTSAEAQYDDNPWNTYVQTGLPAGPISNPGAVAIDAAMNPVEGDWLYFVTVDLNTGETLFTTNLADHNRAVNQWISWCQDNPDAGC